MRRIVLGLIASTALTGAAAAADLPVIDSAPIAAPVAVSSWTGLYFGISAGGGAVVHDVDLGGFASLDGIGGEGVLIDGTLGFDYQISSFVVGLLGDVYWTNISSDASFGPFGAELEANWGFDILARAGVLVNDSVLVYALGGYSWQDFTATINLEGSADEDDSADGWTIGAGIEAKLTDNLSVKGEYRFTQLRDLDFGIDGISVDPSQHTARVGLNYKFNLF